MYFGETAINLDGKGRLALPTPGPPFARSLLSPSPVFRRSLPVRANRSSSPVPEKSLSAAPPPSTRSLPPLPLSVSLPTAPLSSSLPPRPSMVSLPPKPQMTSAPGVPSSSSASGVPRIVQSVNSTEVSTVSASSVALTFAVPSSASEVSSVVASPSWVGAGRNPGCPCPLQSRPGRRPGSRPRPVRYRCW